MRSHLGQYAITTVGRINNLKELVDKSLKTILYTLWMSDGEVNPTEEVAALIDQEDTFSNGIMSAQEAIKGSCTMLVLTPKVFMRPETGLAEPPDHRQKDRCLLCHL